MWDNLFNSPTPNGVKGLNPVEQHTIRAAACDPDNREDGWEWRHILGQQMRPEFFPSPFCWMSAPKIFESGAETFAHANQRTQKY